MELTWKHWYYFVLFSLFLACANAQSIGYETRFGPDLNQRHYLRLGSPSVKGWKLEGRYHFDAKGTRITPSKSFNLAPWVKFKLPLHANVHKEPNKMLTIEPRIIFPLSKSLSTAVQHEFWFNQNRNSAILLDYKVKKWKFRAGWDTSGYFRLMSEIKL